MTIIIDANILISGIINPFGTIPELILLKNNKTDFVLPEYAIEEIALHKSKICRLAQISSAQFEQILDSFLSYVLCFSAEVVSKQDIVTAEKLVASIDEKDAWYVAFAVALNALLWTGDIKLYKGLRKKGFMNVVTTSEMEEIIKGLK